jgi:hypothetical protein
MIAQRHTDRHRYRYEVRPSAYGGYRIFDLWGGRQVLQDGVYSRAGRFVDNHIWTDQQEAEREATLYEALARALGQA